MRILQSEIGLSATHQQSATTTTKISGQLWEDGDPQRDLVATSSNTHPQTADVTAIAIEYLSQSSTRATLISKEQTRLASTPAASLALESHASLTGSDTQPDSIVKPQHEENSTASTEVSDESLLGTTNGSQLILLKRLVESMTGRRVHLVRTDGADGRTSNDSPPTDSSSETARNSSLPPRAGEKRQGFGLAIDIERTNTETKSQNFTATGTIVTTDGRTLDFDVTYVKESTRVDIQRVSIREGDAQVKDPLVLLYSGTTADLAAQAIEFDLDEDGKLDTLPGIANGAYVVYDANRDEVVNGASELLGAKSGDGFAELRSLDDDNNGFIDSSDAAYEALRLWEPTATGKSVFRTLSAAQIGALYTGQVATPLEIRNAQGTLAGQVRASGIYVSETGDVRPLEQIDLVQRASTPRSIDVRA